jgi:hypothetical protein
MKQNHADFNGIKNPFYGIRGKDNPNFGVPKTKEHNEKNRQAHLNQPILTCPYCNKKGKVAPMKQWHFEKCKFKPELI